MQGDNFQLDKEPNDEIIINVDSMISFNKELSKLENKLIRNIQREFNLEKIDSEIDEIVYNLYELIDEEISIIENSF